MNKTFVPLKINAEKEGKELASQFRLDGYPSFIVVDPDKGERLRSVGYMDSKEFIKFFSDKLDDNKTPERLRQRYEAGERSLEIVTLYANSLKEKPYETMEEHNENIAAADDVIQEYFTQLSDSDRFKNENMFIYWDYSKYPEQPSTRFIVDNMNRFIPQMRIGLQQLINKIYNDNLLLYLGGKRKFNDADYQYFKQNVANLAIDKQHLFDNAYGFIEQYAKGDLNAYIDYCGNNYAKLTEDQQHVLFNDYANMVKRGDSATKKHAEQFLRKALPNIDIRSMYYATMQIMKLEGKKE